MRTVFVCLTAMCCCVIVLPMGCSEVSPQAKDLPVLEKREDFRWPEGKRAAISLTFDDARHSQIANEIGRAHV